MREMTCVQCSRVMKYVTNVQDKQVPVCNYTDCPNFWLLQLWNEIMSDLPYEQDDNETSDNN